MKLVGLMPVRNEAWVLGLSARVALMWCDALVIMNHASTDGTSEILCDLVQDNDYRDRLTILNIGGPWDEMEHRQYMLAQARMNRATHIALVDADEILTGNLLQSEIPDWWKLQTAAQDYRLMQLPGYNLRGGIGQYHANGIWGKRWFSLAFKDCPELHWSGDRFHHREPMGKTLANYRPIAQGQGGVMHLWGASERRLKAKHALFAMTERLRWPEKSIAEINRMYGWAIHGEPGHPSFGTPETWTYNQVPESWWAPYAHLMKYLDVDAEPWQEDEVRKLVVEHGKEAFQCLDLFGLG